MTEEELKNSVRCLECGKGYKARWRLIKHKKWHKRQKSKKPLQNKLGSPKELK